MTKNKTNTPGTLVKCFWSWAESKNKLETKQWYLYPHKTSLWMALVGRTPEGCWQCLSFCWTSFLKEIRALFSKTHVPFRSFKTEARQQWVLMEKSTFRNCLWHEKVGGKRRPFFSLGVPKVRKTLRFCLEWRFSSSDVNNGWELHTPGDAERFAM